MTVYDLHTHSHYSDGVLAPASLVELARENGVGVLALTDHDTVAGLAEARSAANVAGLKLVDGVEISVSFNKLVLHVVGLNVDAEDTALLAGLKSNIDLRYQRAEKINRKLEGRGLRLRERVKHHAGGAAPTRTHFARALVESGAVNGMQQAFKRYLGRGKSCFVASQWATLGDAVQWIRTAGGTAVLAHPRVYGLTRTRLRAVLNGFIEAGGRGIEVATAGASLEHVRGMTALANEFGLSASIGSDFHSPDYPWTMVGRCGKLPQNANPIWETWS